MRFLPTRGKTAISLCCGGTCVGIEKKLWCLMPCLLTSGRLLDPETQTLKEHLIDDLDYILVPAEAWDKLVRWYGCIDGQQPIVRKVSMGESSSLQLGFISWFLPNLHDVYFAKCELRQDPQQLF